MIKEKLTLSASAEHHYLMQQCYRIRVIEDAVAELYPSDRIQSPVHLSHGQEAVAVGVCAHLRPTDLVFGTYRGHALYLAKGGDLAAFFAELFGKSTGCASGKGGSMHLADPAVGVMGCSAIVAATISHAVGAALGAKLRTTGQVIACFFGEGATNEGTYHEALNFAALHSVPILFVCENNHFAIHTRSEQVRSYVLQSHAQSYGLGVEVVHRGHDVLDVHLSAGKAIQKIRNGKGPQFLEVHTSRYRQHVGPALDPVSGLLGQTSESLGATADPLVSWPPDENWAQHVASEIKGAVAFAQSSSFPSITDIYEGVY